MALLNSNWDIPKIIKLRGCVVMHDAPSFFSLAIKISQPSLSSDILTITSVYVFPASK